jgi:hypothetical protein
MSSETRFQRIPIYTAILTTTVVMPFLMDPINLPKLWVLSIGASLGIAIYFPQIRSLWSGERKGILLASLLFFSGLLASSLASQQGFFRTLVGAWGRNNGFLSYSFLLIIFLIFASMRTENMANNLIASLSILGIL